MRARPLRTALNNADSSMSEAISGARMSGKMPPTIKIHRQWAVLINRLMMLASAAPTGAPLYRIATAERRDAFSPASAPRAMMLGKAPPRPSPVANLA